MVVRATMRTLQAADVRPAIEARFPHMIAARILPGGLWDEPYAWCTERWGDSALMEWPHRRPKIYPKTWLLMPSSTWVRANGDYYFERADDAFEFKMRWG